MASAFSGGGYRDPSSQVALRRAHCGTSDYDVYEKPPSQCHPPTARPGASMHERGLAIDFTAAGRVITSRASDGLPVAADQRRPLRVPQPAQRALALVDERQLTR